MKKYLFIVLLVGVCSGQIVPDTLVMKSGKTYLGTYYGKDSKHTEFKYQRSMDREKILSSKIEEIRLGDGSKVKKTIIRTEVSNVSSHLNKAGEHLENNVKYTIYGGLLSPFGTALIMESVRREEFPLLGMVISGYAFYLSYEGFTAVAKAGKELKKASKPMREIEKEMSQKNSK